MEIKLSDKYEPLFALLSGEHPKVDTIIITGGRYSQKSFATGLFSCVAAKDYNHRILYTRYTLTSAEDSIIPEFNEKIDLLNAHVSFEVTRDRIRGVHNKSKIAFKGIKTSAGNQTAALKSLKDFSIFLLEEGEEMPNFNDWDKVKKSIRALDVRNLSIIVLNPTTKAHWIFSEFFESRGINEGWNGVHENVMYIHTSYLDMDREFIPDSIFDDFEDKRRSYELWMSLSSADREANILLKKKAMYFKHTIMGGWLEKSEGVIFENWRTGDFIDTGYTLFGADFGFSQDPSTLAKVSIDSKNKKLYIEEKCYQTRMTTTDIYEVMRRECGGVMVVADSAEPRLIEELKKKSINIKGAVKGQGSITAGIALMQDFEIIVSHDSINLAKELNNYSWNDKKSGVPIDNYNHLIDAIRYAVSELMVPKKAPMEILDIL